MADRGNVADFQGFKKPTGSDGNGGNGGLTSHRLTQLEGRMDRLEGKVDQIHTTCTEIKTELKNLATNSFVWRMFAAVGVLLLISLVGHLLIRSFASG